MQYPLTSPGQAVLYLRQTKTGKAMRTLSYSLNIIYQAELRSSDRPFAVMRAFLVRRRKYLQ